MASKSEVVIYERSLPLTSTSSLDGEVHIPSSIGTAEHASMTIIDARVTGAVANIAPEYGNDVIVITVEGIDKSHPATTYQIKIPAGRYEVSDIYYVLARETQALWKDKDECGIYFTMNYGSSRVSMHMERSKLRDDLQSVRLEVDLTQSKIGELLGFVPIGKYECPPGPEFDNIVLVAQQYPCLNWIGDSISVCFDSQFIRAAPLTHPFDASITEICSIPLRYAYNDGQLHRSHAISIPITVNRHVYPGQTSIRFIGSRHRKDQHGKPLPIVVVGGSVRVAMTLTW